MALWDRFEAWLHERTGERGDPWLVWSFTRRLNDDQGVLQFWASRNHRSSVVWDLLDWLVANAPHSSGLVHVHDDEDQPGVTAYGRGERTTPTSSGCGASSTAS